MYGNGKKKAGFCVGWLIKRFGLKIWGFKSGQSRGLKGFEMGPRVLENGGKLLGFEGFESLKFGGFDGFGAKPS